MFTVMLSMSVFAFIGAASPGPVNIIATSSSASFGFKRTVPHVFGASLAYALIVFIAGAGLNNFLILYPQLTEVLKYIGTVFLLHMAFKIGTATAHAAENSQKSSVAPSALQGGLTQGLNPKAWFVSMSGISIFVTPNDPSTLYLLVFTSLSFIICFIGVGLWAAMGQYISTWLTQVRYQIMFNRIMGVLLSLTVVSIWMN